MPKEQEEQLKQQLSAHLVTQAVGIRQRRRVVEEQWLYSRRAWMNSSLDSHFKPTDSSASSYHVPAGRRATERSVVRAVKLLTPNVKWYEVLPVDERASAIVGNVDMFMNYVLRKRIKTRTNISQLVRSLLMYGICHIKTSIKVVNGRVWPQQRVIDPFAFYTFPETVANIEDADIVFEDYLFSYEQYKTFVARGIVEDVHASDLVKPDWPYHLVERLAYQGITDPTQDISLAIEQTSNNLQKTSASFVSITEMWLPKNDNLYQVYLLWNHRDGPRVVGFIKSDYDTPLYRSAVHRPLPGELYTNSMVSDIAELNVMQNDLINKFHEAVDWEQGFVIAQADKRHDSWKAKGRAVWLAQDDPRQLALFVQPPVTSTNLLRAWQIDTGLINSLASAGSIAEGQPGRNMPRAGGAVNSLISLGMADTQDISELIEQEVLTPSLGDIYKVAALFIPDDQLMRIPGGQGLFGAVLKKADILADYEFEWVGSLQFQDEQLRAQRMMIFLNLAIQPQAIQMLAQQGYAFNFPELIKTVWRYGLGERGLQNIIVPLPKMMQDMQGGQQPTQQIGQLNGQQPQYSGRNGVAGLNYSLPTVTQGFVQQ